MMAKSKTYEELLLCFNHEWRQMPFLAYFQERTHRLWSYSYSGFWMERGARADFWLAYYEYGALKWQKKWSAPGWVPKPFKYAVMHAGYMFIAMFLLPRRAWILIVYPIFGLGISLLRALKRVRLTYWVWDHSEGTYPAYAMVDDHAVRHADATLFVSPPMLPAYGRRAPAADKAQYRALLPHGTRLHEVSRRPVDGLIGFIGNFRPEDGLSQVIRALTLDPTLRLEVIGAGWHWSGHEAEIARLGLGERVRFHGRVDDQRSIDAITETWQVGVAVYDATPVTRYVDPGKVKLYLQQGMPVVVTAVVPVSAEITRLRAGEVVPDNEPSAIVAAVRRIRNSPEGYARGVDEFRAKYEFARLYDDGFKFMRDDRAKEMTRKPYDAVLVANFSEWRHMPSMEHFVRETNRLWLYTFNHFRNNPGMAAKFSLERFDSGRLQSKSEWSVPGWLPKPFKYAALYLNYVWIAVFMLPRTSWIVTTYPLICLGQTWFRRLKRFRYAYWVWDYFGDLFPAYSQVDNAAVRHADAVLFVSTPMLPAYDRRAPAARPSQIRKFLPHGIARSSPPRMPESGLIGFIGQVRDEQGVIRLVDAVAADPALRLDVIGTGPLSAELAEYVRRTGVAGRVRLLGRVDDPRRIDEITARWQIGAAPYGDHVVNRYCDPGKIKLYLQQGLPVVTTSTVPIAVEISSERAGEVVPSGSSAELVGAFRKIMADYDTYLPGIEKLRDRYEVVNLYGEGFAFLKS